MEVGLGWVHITYIWKGVCLTLVLDILKSRKFQEDVVGGNAAVDVTWYDFLLCLEARQPLLAPVASVGVNDNHILRGLLVLLVQLHQVMREPQNVEWVTQHRFPRFFCIYTLEKTFQIIAEFGGFIGIIKLL